MLIRIWLAVMSVVLTAAPAAMAQPATEVVLQLDGQSLLENELAWALRKAREATTTPDDFALSAPRIEGRNILVPLTARRGAEATVSKLKELLPGYDVRVRIDAHAEASLTDATLAKRLLAAGASAETSARARLDAAGFVDAVVQLRDVTQLVVTFPAKPTEDAVALLTTPAVVTFNAVARFADASRFTPAVPRNGQIALPDRSRGGALQVVQLDPIVERDGIESADVTTDRSGAPAISLKLKQAAAQSLGRATSALIGHPLAIIIDGRIVSAP